MLALSRGRKQISRSPYPRYTNLREEMIPVPNAKIPQHRTPVQAVERALEHALSITTATTDGDLIARTLTAACQLTGAPVACAIEPGGDHKVHGDTGLAGRLLLAAAAGTRCDAQGDGVTEEFASAGLPSVLTARLDGTRIIVASPTRDFFHPKSASLVALVIAHANAGRDRLREVAVLSRRANSDPLTGLRHYRPFEERLAGCVPDRTAVIAIDVDEFKRINDEQGHQAGDDALVALGAALRSALRGDDHIYRIGGDEFAVVIDVNDPAELDIISRRLLESARRVGYPVSVGAAMRHPDETGRETLLRADKALYQAKRAGRNTVRLAAWPCPATATPSQMI